MKSPTWKRTIRLKASGRVVKTFTLPGVQVGSILEYAWCVRWRGKFPDVLRNPDEYVVEGIFYVPAAQWSLQQELYTRRARFSLRPLPKGKVEWIEVRSPGKERPRQQADGTWLLEIENIPGLEAEEFMPPLGMLQSQVHLLYRVGQGEFWAHFSRLRGEELGKFIGKHKSIDRAAAQLVALGDPPETKLRKLYARVQKVRNLSEEPGALEKPPPANKNVEDVLNRGYAFWNEINYLFVALARATGFRAYIVELTSRDRGVFESRVPDASQLNARVVQVNLPSGPVFLDPATPFCPYGMLPWEESYSAGIRLAPSSEGGGRVSTPLPGSQAAVTKRTSTFRLLPNGSLEGQLRVVFTGQEALTRRRLAVGRDEAGRRKAVEEEVKDWLLAGATVELSAAGEWASSEDPLPVECRIQIPNFAELQGRRLFFPPSVYYAHRPAPFRHARRIHPVYFPPAYQMADQITIELPPGFEVESVPEARNLTAGFGRFETGLRRAPRSVELSRQMVIEGIFFRTEFYRELKDLFEKTKASDEEKVVAPSLAQTGN